MEKLSYLCRKAFFMEQKSKMKKVGVYSGSFNPVHVGHVALAEYLLAHTDLDEIWMVLSPQNPFKQNAELLSDELRYAMLQLALHDVQGVFPSDVELKMPKPSYTADTLRHLSGAYPDVEFSLIIGADNLEIFDRWRDYQYILDNYRLLVYPRRGCLADVKKYNGNIVLVDAPLFDVSSTMIRRCLKNGKGAERFLLPEVMAFINENKLYR